MKDIAIITTHREPNYGNKLQNYALQTVLQRLGYKVDTINDARFYRDLISWRANKKALLHYFIRFRTQSWHIQHAKFFLWSKRHINYSKVNVHSDEDIIGLADKYHYFIVGSDQIWNPEWRWFSNEFGFATFARKEQKIAYAPSLGVSEMLPERIDEYSSFLQNWKALSCREYEGAKIIEMITGTQCPVVPDPTLLLTQKDWNNLSRKPRIKGHYALVYMIGVMADVYAEYITAFERQKGLQIINIRDDAGWEECDPSEFIGLIRDADYMITDSFHGCVFALIYHRPITLFQRILPNEKDQSSRIRTLFRHAGIPFVENQNIYEYHDLIWGKIDDALANKRQTGIEFLSKSLQSD